MITGSRNFGKIISDRNHDPVIFFFPVIGPGREGRRLYPGMRFYFFSHLRRCAPWTEVVLYSRMIMHERVVERIVAATKAHSLLICRDENRDTAHRLLRGVHRVLESWVRIEV